MSYDFDGEYEAILQILPTKATFTNIDAARSFQAANGERVAAALNTTGLTISSHEIPGLPGEPPVTVHVYRSLNVTPNAPCVLRIHGGGFAVGSVMTDLPITVGFAHFLPAVFVSVEYRLAPECPYPAALMDCAAALQWIHAESTTLGIDVNRVALFGTSAGAGLLDIPELDDRLESASMVAFVDTPVWNRPNAELSWQYYLHGLSGDVPIYAAPARAETLENLPPAYISVMEFDPLRDEGIAYAMTLMRSGVHVELHAYPGTFHGSILEPKADVSKRILMEHIAALSRALRIT
ncbi:MAG: alpha/beta hydrolase [Actinobacteria bacterium]|nr:alpha/beta hydrolase [Actinomycetota bacterium]